MKTPLGTAVDLGPGHIVLDGAQLPPPRKGRSSPPSFRPVYCGHGHSSQLLRYCYTVQGRARQRVHILYNGLPLPLVKITPFEWKYGPPSIRGSLGPLDSTTSIGYFLADLLPAHCYLFELFHFLSLLMANELTTQRNTSPNPTISYWAVLWLNEVWHTSTRESTVYRGR